MKETRARGGGGGWLPRALVRVLVLVLTPVLIVSSQGDAALADTTYGDPATVTIGNGQAGWQGNGWSCSVQGYWSTGPAQGPGASGGASAVNGAASCSTNWNLSSFDLTLIGNGPGCSVTWHPGQLDGGGDTAGAFSGDGSPCNVTELCYSAVTTRHSDLWGSETEEGCEPWDLGSPPEFLEESGSCAYGTVLMPVVGPSAEYDSNGGYSRRRGYILAADAPAEPIVDGGGWRGYLVMRPIAGVATQTHSDSANDMPSGLTIIGGVQLVTGLGPAPFTSTGWVITSDETLNYSTHATADGYEIVGGGYVRNDGSTFRTSSNIGVNDPANCKFYWGLKIQPDNPSGSTDDPLGPLPVDSTGGGNTTPPVLDPVAPPVEDPEPDGSCEGFSLTDPGSWGDSAMCAVAGLLGRVFRVLTKIAGTLTGLVGDLLGGLATLFETLFIPDPDSWDVDDLMDQAEARPPISIMTDLAGAIAEGVGAYTTADGCGVLININDAGPSPDAQVSCLAVKSIPGYAAGYAVAQAAIWLGVALGMFNLLTKYLQESS